MEATSFRILDNQYNNIYIGMQYDTLLPYFNLEARNPVNPGAGLAAYVRGKLSNFDLKFDSGFNSYPPLVNLELDTNDGYNDYNYNYGKLDLFSFTDLNLGYYDRGLSIDPSAGIRLYYYDSNGDLVGNYFTLNSTGLTIGSGFIANTTGAYHTNIVNAASHTTSATTSNTTGFFPTSNTPALSLGNSTALWVISANSVAANSVTVTGGNLNTAAIFSSGTVNAANFNTTGYVNTGTLTAATSANVGANVQITTSAVTIGNSTLTTSVSETIYSNTGSASLIVANGTSLATNTTIFANGVNTTGFINAVSHTVGSNFIANSSAIVGTGYANVTTSVNSALLTVGTSFIANTTGVYHTATVNAANIAVGTSFIANTSQVTISGIPLQANGGVGTAGQVLTSNGATGSPYWSTSSGGGSIVSGSGTAILNFGTPGTSGNNEATIAVSGLTTIASTAQVRVWIASDATSSNHTAGDHKYFTSLAGLSVSSVSAGVGFSIFARSIHKLSGNWTVNYFWQNY